MGTAGRALPGAGRLLALAAVLAMAATLATGAHAQLDAAQEPGETTGLDTVYTPIAKEPPEGLFTLLSGPRYQEDKPPAKDQMTDGSRAHFGSDLLDVALRADEDTENAFAVGAACADADGNGAPDDSDTANCTRVPVIYSHTIRDGWQLDHLSDTPGYAASVAIFADGSAIAVGGSGRYPEREAGEDRGHCEGDREPSTDPQDGGSARVWIYRNGSWKELSNRTGPNDGKEGDEVPDAPGLTAVDTYLPNPKYPVEFAAIGGLCQIWHWTEGSFWRTSQTEWQQPFSPQSTVSTKFHLPGLRYRIRQIRFAEPAPGLEPRHRRPRGYAAMSGCCSDEHLATPGILTYATPNDMGPDTEWCEAEGKTGGGNCGGGNGAMWPTNPGDVATAGTWSAGAGASVVRAARPDSNIAVMASLTSGGPYPDTSPVPVVNGPGTIATPTGPAPTDRQEPASRTGQEPVVSGTSEPLFLASTRLTDGAGDRGGGNSAVAVNVGVGGTHNIGQRLDVPLTNIRIGTTSNDAPETKVGGDRATGPDGVPDWVVGVLRSSNQAIALGTDPAQLPPPDPAVEPLPPRYGCAGSVLGHVLGADANALADQAGCLISSRTGEHTAAIQENYDPLKATGHDRAQRAAASYKLMTLPTYALNSIGFVDSEGKGFAVGDHGAIMRVDAGRSAAKGNALEPPPPNLGQRRSVQAPSREDWASRRPEPTQKPGEVPPAHSSTRIKRDRPELALEGAPGELAKADEIIMSRSGDDGWAIGYGGELELSHYDGARWTHCAEAAQALHDSACQSVAELRSKQKISLVAADRVPLERDSDPTNDDELEIVAVSRNQIIRYRARQWKLEDAAALEPIGGQEGLDGRKTQAGILDVAFVAPDDGLIVSDWYDEEYNPDAVQSNERGTRQVWFRFGDGDGGARWRPCNRVVTPGSASRNPELVSDCDPHNRLPRGTKSISSSQAFCGELVGDNGCITRLFSAGDRIYASGFRRFAPPCVSATCSLPANTTPLLLHWEHGKPWSATPAKGEIDPPPSGGNDTLQKLLRTDDFKFTGDPGIARRPDGSYEGWAVVRAADDLGRPTLLRLSAGGDWAPFKDSGAHHSLAKEPPFTRSSIAIRPGTGKASPALLAEDSVGLGGGGRLYELDTVRMRWRLVQTPFLPPVHSAEIAQTNYPGKRWALGLTDDRKGGFWAPTDDGLFYRYTDRPRKPVFEEAPQPSHSGARMSAIAGAPDGTVWGASPSNQLYRYDRGLGWDRIRIPGWEPDRGTITKPSAADDIALAPDSSGLAVGEGGRIARIGADGTVVLDPASGHPCDRSAPTPPCGTTRDLLAAAAAPDGSMVAVGKGRSLLWSPAGGELRSIEPPAVAENESFEAASMPEPGVIWLVASAGRLWRGQLGPGGWSWRREELPGPGKPAQIALGRGESGYLIRTEPNRTHLYERSAGGSWSKALLPVDERTAGLSSVALSSAGGEGALVGGAGGLILTRRGDRFEVARPPDPAVVSAALPVLSPTITDLVLSPGYAEAEAEAWALAPAASGDRGTDRLFHHSSPRPDGLLDPVGRSRAMPDAPAPRKGEVSLAAFGKSDCQMGFDSPCKPMAGMQEYTQVLTGRAIDEISARSHRPGGPQVAVFTGDAVDSAGHPGSEPLEEATGPPATDRLNSAAHFAGGISGTGVFPYPSFYGTWRLRRWGEAVADRLSDRGVPVLGAIGARDVSDYDLCSNRQCSPTRRVVTPTGENIAWRRAMELRSKPWGNAPAPDSPHAKLRKISGRGMRVRHEERSAKAPVDEVPSRTTGTGGTDTNYAVDVFDPEGRRKTARLVFVDNSSGALATSDALQQPLRPEGQAAWLDAVLCVRGDVSAGGSCTREPGQRAVVVANTPTYSYGPGAGSHTAADGAAFEAILMKNKADLVVSGRIGWNGLYWATAPGVHEPCPGSDYPQEPPSDRAGVCGQALPELDAGNQPVSAATVAATLGESDVLAPTEGLSRALPFVVASGAGGRFFGGALANAADQDADKGLWHGYTIARLDPSGDPRRTVVEQRPVYDWVGIEAAERTLRPGQKMLLRGYARGPLAFYIAETAGDGIKTDAMVRFDRIDSPAVTHRYALVEADPDKPWLPRTDEQGEYVPLDPSIATLDSQSGQIKVGRGNNPRTFAVAVLSLGCVAKSDRGTCDPDQIGVHAASYPLVFEPRRTFAPKATTTAQRLPSVIVQSAQAGISPPASPGPPPQIGSISPPALPSFPGVSAPPATPPLAQPTPTPPPPPPPAPPPPAALGIASAPPGLTVAPPAAVIPPPAPPINPAPPGGARKEARQRQAATEKSGSGSGESGVQEGVDVDKGTSPTNPHGSEMTRLDRTKAQPSSTPVARPDQPSAWARGALYGGGLFLAALAMSGFWTARPRPRPRPPAVPAPARSRAWTRRW